jgi:transposase
MEHYVGLDVSLKLTAVCIVDRTGKIEREGVVHSDPEAIAAFIKSNAPHVARIGTRNRSNVDMAVDRVE